MEKKKKIGLIETNNALIIFDNINKPDYSSFFNFIKPSLIYLLNRGISHPPDFSLLFKQYFGSRIKITELFLTFVNFLGSKHEDKFNWFSKRNFKQLNNTYLNFVIARIIHEYGNEFIDFINDYFTKNPQIVTNPKEFIDKLKEII